MNSCRHPPTRVVAGVQLMGHEVGTLVLTCCEHCRPAVEEYQATWSDAVSAPIEELEELVELLGDEAWMPVAV